MFNLQVFLRTQNLQRLLITPSVICKHYTLGYVHARMQLHIFLFRFYYIVKPNSMVLQLKNIYLQSTLQHRLRGPKHLQSPPLPVAFLLFLYQCCGVVWYETTATHATVRMSVSNQHRGFIASGECTYP